MNEITMDMDYSTLREAAVTNPQHPRYKSTHPIGDQMLHDATEIAAVLDAHEMETAADYTCPPQTKLHIRISDRGGRVEDFFFTYPPKSKTQTHQTRPPIPHIVRVVDPTD